MNEIVLDRVPELEAMLLAMPQIDFQTTHELINGIYARTIVIPAGGCLTGAVHKTDHVCVLHGDITVTTDEGMQRLTGFHVITVKAGAKRAGYAHAETHWTTICKTSYDDIKALPMIESELVHDADKLATCKALSTSEKPKAIE